MTGTVLGVPPRLLRVAAIAGAGIGVVYTLSPLTVWFAFAMAALCWWAGRGLPASERRWLYALLGLAILVRVAAIAGLFALTNHQQVAFGSFFGDEEYFIKRSIWLRNVALGIPIHRADLIYSFDEYSDTSYLYVLGFLQVLVGPAPYGAHLFGAALYLFSAVLLYRLVRPSYGPVPAQAGLALLLFLPSLLAWSMSALKEPLYFLLSAGSLVAAAKVFRSPSWGTRMFACAFVVANAFALESIRQAGLLLSAAGVAGGLAAAFVLKRPRVLLALAVAVPLLTFAGFHRPDVQFRALSAVKMSAQQHWGHVATSGYVYKVLDPRFYLDRGEILTMQRDEALRFLVRALVGYVTVPQPWRIQSRAALAYLPEQVIWYCLVAFIPLGLLGGLRRDRLVTSLLLAHGLAAALLVALTSGNVGTLVRHRGLALPYLVWFSVLGACDLLARFHASPDAVAPMTPSSRPYPGTDTA